MNGVLEQLLAEVQALRADVAEIKAIAKPPAGLVSIAEWAERRNVSPATARKAIHDGRLACVKNGRAWRLRADAEIAEPDAPSEDDAQYALRILSGGRR